MQRCIQSRGPLRLVQVQQLVLWKPHRDQMETFRVLVEAPIPLRLE